MRFGPTEATREGVEEMGLGETTGCCVDEDSAGPEFIAVERRERLMGRGDTDDGIEVDCS
jgi:hypothetical protein